MVQSRPLALTMRSISAESLATFRRNVRRPIAFRSPSFSKSTATPTTRSLRTPVACMAVTVLRAQSLTRVVGPNPGGPSADSTASWAGRAARSSSTLRGSPRSTVTPSRGGPSFSGERTKAVTWWPRWRACSTSARPVPPVAPRTKSLVWDRSRSSRSTTEELISFPPRSAVRPSWSARSPLPRRARCTLRATRSPTTFGSSESRATDDSGRQPSRSASLRAHAQALQACADRSRRERRRRGRAERGGERGGGLRARHALPELLLGLRQRRALEAAHLGGHQPLLGPHSPHQSALHEREGRRRGRHARAGHLACRGGGRGHIETEWRKSPGELRVSYANGDFRRALIYRLLNCDTLPYYGNGRVSFVVALAAGKSWHTCAEYVLVSGDQARAPVYGCLHREESHLDRLQAEWLARATRITTANEDIYRFWRQSLEDMGALRLHEEDYASNLWLAAAGVPWYVTVFGRDSLIASMQNMIVDPTFALGALRWLGELQATEADDWRDAQPGKIPHEMRFGELAHLRKIPHIPYYGTADATALYLIVLHEAWRWLGEIELLREYREIAVGCLDWIDRHGDLDGDGFQEYETRSPVGYENQGWKDASDAVVYPDGSQVRQPKALCELQGYVFDAWMRMAEVFDVLEEPERSAQLRGKAELLRARFEDRFWCEEIGSYVFGLDREKRQIKTVVSNAGHCLWSGIASPERAARVVARLLEPDMWSGWGIRTLSAGNPAYHPFSYQRGSVWPHDNGIIALGFKRYGFGGEAARVARDLSEAASSFELYRIPELYGGVPRGATSFPVQYPGANAPQAWAAGSIFHCIQAILGLGADAPSGRLLIAPELPHWLPDIVLHGLKVGGARVDLRFWREGDRSRWEVLGQDGAVEVREGSSGAVGS